MGLTAGVAASAIWLGVPLVAPDAIFADVKDLTLLTELGAWAGTSASSQAAGAADGAGYRDIVVDNCAPSLNPAR